MKTTEGIVFRAFVQYPGKLKESTTLCEGKSVKSWLKEKYNTASFGLDNLLHDGKFKCMGWEFDLRPHLKKYIYTFYGSIYSAWAPDVASLRKAKGLRRFEKVALSPAGF